MKSPIYCEHANECPHVCPCPPDCYCKDHTCKNRANPVEPPKRTAWERLGEEEIPELGTKLILGISGLAGSGKDTVAKFLNVSFTFSTVAMADPLKRIVKDVYDFSDEQLWGPSDMRNGPDKRYPREHTWKVKNTGEDSIEMGWSCICCGVDRPSGNQPAPQCYLTPRYSLQTLGTEWGRHNFSDTWAQKCLRTAKNLNDDSDLRYDQRRGVYRMGVVQMREEEGKDPQGVSIPDVRFKNEITIVKQWGGKLLRVRRPSAGLKGAAGLHQSELEQASIPDSAFDVVLENDGTLDDLQKKAIEAIVRLAS